METLFTFVQKEDENLLLLNIFEAYEDARKNKRAKISQIEFEYYYERNLIKLHKEIINRTYKPLPSTAFITTKPVIREVFAADFQDRVIHHLIFNEIAPLFEKEFIEDSYSCRKTKGTLYGVNRVFDFINSNSQNYTHDSYILKLDIKSYFYSINKDILYKIITKTLLKYKSHLTVDFETIDYLIHTTIFSDATTDVKLYKDTKNWKILPKNKSLFYANKGYGLPIGNLTSQLFSNIYMNELDNYITKTLQIEYYGRYVDDFILIHNSKKHLLSLIKKIKLFLHEKLELTLHPKKIYIQHYSKGVKFLGAYIKPHVKYIDKRTKGNFYKLIYKINTSFETKTPNEELLFNIRNSINSYLGTLIHFSSFKLRKKILLTLDKKFLNYFFIDKNYSKVILKDYY